MLNKNYINAGIALNKYFDCVVMLTQSYWKTEGRKNRYFYATRFARHLPVLFVQPDQKQKPYLFEESGYQNIDILNANSKYTIEESFNKPVELEEEACDMLERAILSRGFEAPFPRSHSVCNY